MEDPADGVPVARGPKWVPVGLASLVEKAPPPSSAPDSAVQEFDAAQPVKHAASSDPVIDRIFGGKYRVLDRLGAGGMAVVYRAQEQGLITREVALKVLTPESALSQATIARFLKEAQAISNVKHPNVVQLIDLGRTDDGQIYLVMERLVGKTLHEELRGMGENGEAFTWERLAPLILDICGALQAAHKQKVIHRDMKPSNCFLCERDDERPYIKVLDFGIAKVQSGGVSDDSIETPLTQEGMFLGTPNYAAPEISNPGPEQTLDGRVDIFSVGVLMYQCLTGTLPFQEVRGNRLAVLYKTANERPESPRSRAPDLDIPFDVDALVMRAMEIKPGDRFATVAELAGAIRATLQAPGTTPGSGGLSVSGSILEITPSSVLNPPADRTPDRSVILGNTEPVSGKQAAAGEQGTPVPPGHPPVSTAPDSPTSIQDIGRRSSVVVLSILVAMVLGLVVLFALIIYETANGRVRPEDQGKAPAPTNSSGVSSAPGPAFERPAAARVPSSPSVSAVPVKPEVPPVPPQCGFGSTRAVRPGEWSDLVTGRRGSRHRGGGGGVGRGSAECCPGLRKGERRRDGCKDAGGSSAP